MGQLLSEPPPRVRYDAELVIARLEEAGATLLALPISVWPAGVRSGMPDYRYEAEDLEDQMPDRERADPPPKDRITRMDECLAWPLLIPLDPAKGAYPWSHRGGAVVRRIVSLRMLIHPVSDRRLWSWRRIGAHDAVRLDHMTVKNWHARGIDAICVSLNRMNR